MVLAQRAWEEGVRMLTGGVAVLIRRARRCPNACSAGEREAGETAKRENVSWEISRRRPRVKYQVEMAVEVQVAAFGAQARH